MELGAAGGGSSSLNASRGGAENATIDQPSLLLHTPQANQSPAERQHSMTESNKFSLSGQHRGRFRPSFAAFSSNWSSSGSEGRGTTFGRRNNNQAEQQTLSPHSLRGAPVARGDMPNVPGISDQQQLGTAYRSPRLSPLHSFDSMIGDHHTRKKMHSEFPFAKRPTKSFKYDPGSHSMMTTIVPTTSFPEVIEEDKAEAENQVSGATHTNPIQSNPLKSKLAQKETRGRNTFAG